MPHSHDLCAHLEGDEGLFEARLLVRYHLRLPHVPLPPPCATQPRQPARLRARESKDGVIQTVARKVMTRLCLEACERRSITTYQRASSREWGKPFRLINAPAKFAVMTRFTGRLYILETYSLTSCLVMDGCTLNTACAGRTADLACRTNESG